MSDVTALNTLWERVCSRNKFGMILVDMKAWERGSAGIPIDSDLIVNTIDSNFFYAGRTNVIFLNGFLKELYIDGKVDPGMIDMLRECGPVIDQLNQLYGFKDGRYAKTVPADISGYQKGIRQIISAAESAQKETINKTITLGEKIVKKEFVSRRTAPHITEISTDDIGRSAGTSVGRNRRAHQVPAFWEVESILTGCFGIFVLVIVVIWIFSKLLGHKDYSDNYYYNTGSSSTSYEETSDYYDDYEAYDDYYEEDYYDYGEDFYYVPYSSESYIDRIDVHHLSSEELTIAINEIYARHGCIMPESWLQEHFDKQIWYTPTIARDDFDYNSLNQYEKENIRRMVEYGVEWGYWN